MAFVGPEVTLYVAKLVPPATEIVKNVLAVPNNCIAKGDVLLAVLI